MKGQIFLSLNSDLNSEKLYFEIINALTYMKNKGALNNFNVLSFYEMKQK